MKTIRDWWTSLTPRARSIASILLIVAIAFLLWYAMFQGRELDWLPGILSPALSG
jgi:hypothetical protein